MNGNGILVLPKLRPVKSTAVTPAGSGSLGVGVSYGMGIGAVRVAGISYSIVDAAGVLSMAQQEFWARIVVLNGDYPYDATQFSWQTDLTTPIFDVLLDRIVASAEGTIETWFSGNTTTDDGKSATALISQIHFPAGQPAGSQPVSTLLMHGDHYKNRELALSQGSIFGGD